MVLTARNCSHGYSSNLQRCYTQFAVSVCLSPCHSSSVITPTLYYFAYIAALPRLGIRWYTPLYTRKKPQENAAVKRPQKHFWPNSRLCRMQFFAVCIQIRNRALCTLRFTCSAVSVKLPRIRNVATGDIPLQEMLSSVAGDKRQRKRLQVYTYGRNAFSIRTHQHGA